MNIDYKKGGRPTKRPTEYELAMKYSGMTALEIANEYGVSESTVRRWISEYRKKALKDASEND